MMRYTGLKHSPSRPSHEVEYVWGVDEILENGDENSVPARVLQA